MGGNKGHYRCAKAGQACAHMCWRACGWDMTVGRVLFQTPTSLEKLCRIPKSRRRHGRLTKDALSSVSCSTFVAARVLAVFPPPVSLCRQPHPLLSTSHPLLCAEVISHNLPTGNEVLALLKEQPFIIINIAFVWVIHKLTASKKFNLKLNWLLHNIAYTDSYW